MSSRFTTDEGEKHLILAKVATGRYCRGNNKMTRANLGDGVHSTVDSTSNPTIFVVYHDAAAYPEYVIKFSKHQRRIEF